MKRVVLILALALAIPTLALAGNFDYYTFGQFSGGTLSNGNHTVTVGGTSITFADQGNAGNTAGTIAFGPGGLFATPTNITLGQFNTVSTSAPPGDSLVGIGFTLTIFQVVPTSANGFYFGSLSGNVVSNSSTGKYFLNNLSADTLVLTDGAGGTLNYALVLDNDATCGVGNRCIQIGGPGQSAQPKAFVTAVPEPASIMLFGSGLTGLAG